MLKFYRVFNWRYDRSARKITQFYSFISSQNKSNFGRILTVKMHQKQLLYTIKPRRVFHSNENTGKNTFNQYTWPTDGYFFKYRDIGLD